MIYSKSLSAFLIPSICLVLLLILLLHRGRRRKIILLSRIPGPKGIPFFGNALEYSLSPVELFRYVVESGSWWRQQTPIMLVWILQRPEVHILTPETAGSVLRSTSNIDKGTSYELLHPWLGTGLLTASGNKWHSRRKMITPTFHYKILGDFLQVMNKQATVFVGQLREHKGGSAFNIHPFLTRCTLDIICETAMGCSINAQTDQESEYLKAVGRISTLVTQRIYKPWLPILAKFHLTKESKEFDQCIRVLHGFTRTIIHQRRNQHSIRKCEVDINGNQDQIGQKQRFAFLDHLLEISNCGEHLSDEDIREEVDTFMLGGHDTTATAISWALYLIGRDSEVQAHIHAEMHEVFGDDKIRPATMDDLSKMQYLGCCIKETLRLFPPVPAFSRNLTEDLVCDKYIIPSETTVVVAPYMVHRDPNHWPDPEVYNPDRFRAENCSNRHPYAYIPFSAGSRNCIGQKFAIMNIKTILSTVFRNFKIESVVSRENLNIVGDLVIKSDDGIWIKLHHN